MALRALASLEEMPTLELAQLFYSRRWGGQTGD